MSIPFVTYDGNNFGIAPEARQFLASINHVEELGVVSIIGKPRSGKSFFLNNVILGREDFEVSHTTNPCTKGIWISTQLVDSDKGRMKVLIMDVEGLGGTDDGSTNDNRIILLPLLLSSYLVYNSMGYITEQAIRSLGVVLGLAKQLQLKEAGGFSFPFFHWIIRDFTLELTDTYGNPISEMQYLENSLEEQRGLTETIENKNRIRRKVKEVFKQRSCNTLIRPYNEDPSKLRAQFSAQSSLVRNRILSTVQPKEVKGNKLSPLVFLQFAQALLLSINDKSSLNIENIWKVVYITHQRDLLNNLRKQISGQIQEMRQDELPKAFNRMRIRFDNILSKSSFSRDHPSPQIEAQIEAVVGEMKRQIDERTTRGENRRLDVGLEDFYSQLKANQRNVSCVQEVERTIQAMISEELVVNLNPQKAQQVKQNVRVVLLGQLASRLEDVNTQLAQQNSCLKLKSGEDSEYNTRLETDLRQLQTIVGYLRRELDQNIKQKDNMIRNLQEDVQIKKTKMLKQAEEICTLNQKLQLIEDSEQYSRTLCRLEKLQKMLHSVRGEYSQLEADQIKLKSTNYCLEQERRQLQAVIASLREGAEQREAEVLAIEQRIVEQVEKEERRLGQILEEAEVKARDKDTTIYKLERIIIEVKGRPRKVEEICEINSLRSQLEQQQTRNSRLEVEMDTMRSIFQQKLSSVTSQQRTFIGSKSAVMNVELTPKGLKMKSFKSPGRDDCHRRNRVCMEAKMAIQEQLNKETKSLITNLLEREQRYVDQISLLKGRAGESYMDSDFSSIKSATRTNLASNSFVGISVNVPSFTIRSLADGHTVTEFRVEFQSGVQNQWNITIRYKELTAIIQYLANTYPQVPEFKLPKTNKAEDKKKIIQQVLKHCLLIHQFRKDETFKAFIQNKPRANTSLLVPGQDAPYPNLGSPKGRLNRVLSKQNAGMCSAPKKNHFSIYIDS